MIPIRYKITFVTLLLFSVMHMYAQTPKPSFTLFEPESGTKDYRAGNFVKLKNGFSYRAVSGTTFKAHIIKDTTFTIVSVTNPQPGAVHPQLDDDYTPGGSYGNDPVTSGNGVSAVLKLPGATVTPVSAVKTIAAPYLWFKTVPLTNNLNGAYEWKDITGKATVHKYSTAGAAAGDNYAVTREKLVAYNFNPAMDMTYENVSKEILVKNSNLGQMTIVGVWGTKQDFTTPQFLFAVNGRRKESIIFTKDAVGETDPVKTDLLYGNDSVRNFLYRNSTVEGSNSNKFAEKSLRTGVYYRANQPDNGLWGEKKQAVITLGAKYDTTNVNKTSTFAAKWHNFPEIKGFTPEMLVFDRLITPSEARIYESYLGIKYGLTLDKSYVNARDSIIWNKSTNQTYHNRVTAYGREDVVGLNQKISTSSYTEAPFYSYLIENDAYQNHNSYLQASSNKLLVAGVQQGNNLPDGKYVIFGDNNAAFNQFDSVPGFKIMKREWLLNTNLKTFSEFDAINHVQWTGNTGIFINEEDENNFNNTIFRAGNQGDASIVTGTCLNGPDGYFSWIVEQEYGPITVKFGANQSVVGGYDCGYSITIDGQVRKIVNGAIQTYNLFTVERGQKLEMEKNGQLLFLRVNGIRYKDSEIVISNENKNKPYYGCVTIGNNRFDIKLSTFRQGGFTDTGNRLELSYAAGLASDFTPFRTTETYLLVDRTGEGNFNQNTEKYLCSTPDEARSKIIFTNIFWDRDGNGRDAFTFAYSVPVSGGVKQHNENDVVPEDMPGEDVLLIYYRDIRIMNTITVQLQTAKPSPAMILMYDISGRLVFKQSYPETSEIRYQDIKMPVEGIYIVKVVTNEKEYTRKVVSKR